MTQPYEHCSGSIWFQRGHGEASLNIEISIRLLISSLHVAHRLADQVDRSILDELLELLTDAPQVNVILTCNADYEDFSDNLECEEIRLEEVSKGAAKAGTLHEELTLYAHDAKADGTIAPRCLLDLYEAEALLAVLEKLIDVEKPVAAIYRADDGACIVRLWICDVGRLHKLRDTMLQGEFDVRLTKALKEIPCVRHSSPHDLSVVVDRTHFAVR